MPDLYLGVLLVVLFMTLIFFGPELGTSMKRKVLKSRSKLARNAFRRAMGVRRRKVTLNRSLAHL